MVLLPFFNSLWAMMEREGHPEGPGERHTLPKAHGAEAWPAPALPTAGGILPCAHPMSPPFLQESHPGLVLSSHDSQQPQHCRHVPLLIKIKKLLSWRDLE